jgi:hypothetical protein
MALVRGLAGPRASGKRMKACVGVTDSDWYRFLRDRAERHQG